MASDIASGPAVPTHGRTSHPDRIWLWACALITLATFAMYVFTLGKQSLWPDEGLTVAFAGRPLIEVLRTMIWEDLHPPLYYLIMHFWMILAGRSELAVRMPSAFAAVLLVPLGFAVVREVYGKEGAAAGIAAAALIGASPFIAHYAQETRMYSLTAALTLATVWAYLRATRTRTRRWWLAFGCLLATGLYTLYFAAFIVPAFWLYALLFDHKSLRGTVLNTVMAGVLYLPWVVPAYLQLARLQRSPDYWLTTQIDLKWFAGAMLDMLLPNLTGRWALLLVGAIALAFAGFVLTRGLKLSQRGRRFILVALAFLSPFALTYVTVALVPKFAPRYAIMTAAPLYICVCLGLYGLLSGKPVTRILFGLLAAAAVLVSLRSAIETVEGRLNARDDTRAVGAYLTQNVQADEALVLVENAPYALEYYYRGGAARYGYHVGEDFEGAASMLTRLLRTRTERIWLVHWRNEFADPTDMILTELLRVGRIAVKEEFHGYRVYGFDIRDYDYTVSAYPEPAQRIGMDFVPGIRLVGFDRLSGEAGQIHYVLYWQALEQLARNYSLTLTFESEDGTEYIRRDQALCTDYFLPPVWPVQKPIRGRVDLILPGDLPPLDYRVYVRVWDPQSQRGLDLVDESGHPLGQALLLEELVLSKEELAESPSPVTNSLSAKMGDHLQLLGYELAGTTYNAGDTLYLTLWWQSNNTPEQDHQVRVRLLDGAEAVIWEAARPIVAGYPTARWQAGEINRGIYRLPIPSDLPGGEYTLQAGIGDEQIALTAIEIEAQEHRYDMPPMQQSVGAQFESGVVLLGYDLQTPAIQPGGTMTVTLYWQTKEVMAASYKVSVQVLGTGPRIIAQHDSIPANWTRPTTAWLVGEVITDEHVLELTSDAAPGTYTVIVALYEEASSRRLRVEQGGTGDSVTIATVHNVP